MAAFWANGFEATTLNDLEKATGVDRSSLYNSFGGKRGLYNEATNLYLSRAEDELLGPLLHGSDDGLADIEQFFRQLQRGLTSDDAPDGCLIVNDMAAGSDPAAAVRYLSLLETGLDAALTRAVPAGLDASTIDQRRQVLATSVLGINLVSRHAATDDEVRRLIDAAVAELRSWRTPA